MQSVKGPSRPAHAMAACPAAGPYPRLLQDDWIDVEVANHKLRRMLGIEQREKKKCLIDEAYVTSMIRRYGRLRRRLHTEPSRMVAVAKALGVYLGAVARYTKRAKVLVAAQGRRT